MYVMHQSSPVQRNTCPEKPDTSSSLWDFTTEPPKCLITSSLGNISIKYFEKLRTRRMALYLSDVKSLLWKAKKLMWYQSGRKIIQLKHSNWYAYILKNWHCIYQMKGKSQTEALFNQHTCGFYQLKAFIYQK